MDNSCTAAGRAVMDTEKYFRSEASARAFVARNNRWYMCVEDTILTHGKQLPEDKEMASMFPGKFHTISGKLFKDLEQAGPEDRPTLLLAAKLRGDL